jgi:hypothetical protein
MVGREFLFPIEGHRVQFRLESFNFTKTPTFGPPNAARITVAEDPRRIQFALKYLF